MDGPSMGSKTAGFVSSVLLKHNALKRRQQCKVIRPVRVRMIWDEHVKRVVKVRNIYARGKACPCTHLAAQLAGVYGE
jgi:hypothetical protein